MTGTIWARSASDRAPRLVLALVLLTAAARLWAARHDLPFSYFGDEVAPTSEADELE